MNSRELSDLIFWWPSVFVLFMNASVRFRYFTGIFKKYRWIRLRIQNVRQKVHISWNFYWYRIIFRFSPITWPINGLKFEYKVRHFSKIARFKDSSCLIQQFAFELEHVVPVIPERKSPLLTAQIIILITYRTLRSGSTLRNKPGKF